MRVLVTILTFWMLSFTSFSQEIELENDTLTDDFIEHLFFNKTKIEFRLSTNNTLLTSGVSAKFTNIRIGVRFKKHYKFGFLLSNMRSISFDTPEDPNVSSYQLKFNGYGGYLEYVVLKNYRFEFSVPVSIASMQAEATAYNSSGFAVPKYDTSSQRFPVLSVGVYGAYSMNYWLAISAGVGYRWAFSESDYYNSLLSTPYYSLGLKLQIGNLYRSIFHKDQVLYMKSVYFRDRKPEKSAKQLRHSKNITSRKNKRKNR